MARRLRFLIALCMALSILTPLSAATAVPTQEITIDIEYDGTDFGGPDSGANNGEVLGGDAVGIRIDWNNNEEDADEVVVEFTIPYPSGFSATLPPNCLTTGVAIPSEIVQTPAAPATPVSATLVCNLGPQIEGSNGVIHVVVLAGALASGTQIPLIATIGDGVTPNATSNELAVTTISEEPSWSLHKSVRGLPLPADPKGQWRSDSPTAFPALVNAAGERGNLFIFGVALKNSGPLLGAGPLDDSGPLYFEDFIGGLTYPNARLATADDMAAAGLAGNTPCGPVDTWVRGFPFGAPGIHPDATPDNTAFGSGNWSCNFTGTIASGNTGLVEVTVTDYSTSVGSRPTRDSLNSGLGAYTPTATSRIVMSGQIAVWIPETDVEDKLGIPTSGTVRSYNEVGVWTDLDGDGVVDTDDDPPDGADEMGPWTHPIPGGGTLTDADTGGIPTASVSTDTSSDDFQRLSITRSNPGSYIFYYRNYYQEMTRKLGAYTTLEYDSRGSTVSNAHDPYISTQTQLRGAYKGDGTVVPGQHWTTYQMKSRSTSGLAENFVMCQLFDTRMITVADNQPWEHHTSLVNWPFSETVVMNPGQAGVVAHVLAFTGSPTSGVANPLPLVEGVDYVLEYSAVPPTAAEGTPGPAPGLPTDAAGSAWNTRAFCDDDLDGDGANDWTSDLSDPRFASTANASGFGSEYPDLTRIRMRSLRPQAPTEQWSYYTTIKADPDAGQTANGTILATSANYARWPAADAWTGTAGDGTVTAYQPFVYDSVAHCQNRTTPPDCPNDGTNSSSGDLGYGDRTALGPAFMLLSKSVQGQTSDLKIGDTVVWEVAAQIYEDSALDAFNVVVQDTLPAGVAYVNATPAPTSVSGQVIRWEFPTVDTVWSGNFVIESVITEGLALSSKTNRVTLNAEKFDGTPFDQLARTRTVRLGQPYEEYEIVKDQVSSEHTAIGSPIVYTLTYTNQSPQPLDAPVIIDILPWNGDSAIPPTNVPWPFPAGSTAPPSALVLDPGDGRAPPSDFAGYLDFVSANLVNGESIEYTGAAPATISPDPEDPTNLAAGSTVWCTAIAGGAGCPTSLAGVTALRITGGAALSGGESLTIEVVVLPTGGDCDDIYTNTFGSRTDTILLPVRANDVTAVTSNCPGIDIEKDTNGVQADNIDEDIDGDGVLDTADEDIDGDGVLDVAEDTNGNGALDDGEDIDGDGRLDLVDEDLDGDGNLDVNEDVHDANGVLDVAAPAGANIGPAIPVGGTVTWTYVVENTGTTALGDAEVTDSTGVVVDCDIDGDGALDGTHIIPLMLPGDIVTCEATGTATTGQYTNDSAVTGTPLVEDPDAPGTYLEMIDPATGEPVAPVTDDDPSAYYGVEPGINIEKSTNTEDADTPTGPVVPVGGAVTWEYVVTNTGDTPLLDSAVTDDQGVTIACDLDGDGVFEGGNVIALMVPGAEVTCQGTGAAIEGQYENNATVEGTAVWPTEACVCDPNDPTSWPSDPADYSDIVDPETGEPVGVEAEDPSHYFAATPSIDIEKSTNGSDADEPTGPIVPLGDPITWEYVVTNDGTAAVLNATVTDDQGVSVDCGDGTNIIPLLLPGDAVTCTGTGVAIAGQYENNATVDGVGAMPDPATCGCDLADPTTWPSDPADYVDLVDPETGEPVGVTDEDPSHYFGGVEPGIDLEKSTNGEDADAPTGPSIPAGDPVTWEYVVTNTGATALADVTVVDDQGVAIDCGDGTNVILLLLPAETVACTGTGIAAAGQYMNNASVEGAAVTPDPATCGCDPADPGTWPDDPSLFIPATDPATGEPISVTDEDPSHYFGSVEPGIMIEKSTNGTDADVAPGPSIASGDAVFWEYIVTNTGDTALLDVTVSDSQGVAVDCGDGTNVIAILLPGESATCNGTGIAIVGDYENIGSVDGAAAIPDPATCGCDPADPTTWPDDPSVYTVVNDPATGEPLTVTDEDPSHYQGDDSAALNEGDLPQTGYNLRPLMLFGASTLLAGYVLLMWIRRRDEDGLLVP